MNFVFVEDKEEEEELDLSDLFDTPKEEVQVAGLSFTFEGSVPAARSITDEDVQQKARQGRRNRRTKTKSYEGKQEDGWSYLCAAKEHLSLLCSRKELDCTCSCHDKPAFIEEEIDKPRFFHVELGWGYYEGSGPASYRVPHKVMRFGDLLYRIPESDLYEREEDVDKGTQPIEFEFVSGDIDEEFILLVD